MTSRKLHLVAPAPELDPGAFDDELPPDEAEIEAAAALRRALDDGGDPVAHALRAAWAPDAMSTEDHDALVARGLGDPLAPPTALEMREAERLREALDDGEGVGDAGLLRALAAAALPGELNPRFHEVLLAKVLDDPLAEPSEGEIAAAAQLREALDPASRVAALGGPRGDGIDLVHALRSAYRPEPLNPERNARLVARAVGRSRRNARGVVVGLASVLALAAGVALVLRVAGPLAPDAPAPAASLIRSRSTAELFDAAEPFPRTGGESRRINRIASAREADLRANRFAAWGAR